MKTDNKPQGLAIMIAIGGKAPEVVDKTGETKTSGIKIRGCGAATKGTKARGPMG
jgi:hypothetical protein